jgi:hypothetical protein
VLAFGRKCAGNLESSKNKIDNAARNAYKRIYTAIQITHTFLKNPNSTESPKKYLYTRRINYCLRI